MGKTDSVIYGHQNDTWHKAGSEELSEMISEGKEIEMTCQFCDNRQTFNTDELKALLRSAKN